jgi:hypothetical protein
MRRVSIALLVVVTIATAAQGQARQPGEPVTLRLYPMAPAVPSLRYRLLPDPQELTAGNAAAGYYRALASFVENAPLLAEIKKDYWSTWASQPLKELPLTEAKQKLSMCRHLIREVEIAARKRSCDWEIDGRPEGIGLLLPDVQGYRHIANVLAVKARIAIAEKQWDQAAETLRAGYALGRHLGEAPTFLHGFVGLAIGGVMNRQVEELIQQPDAPNLYWPLVTMPRPFVRFDNALREESTALERSSPWLKRMEQGPLSEEQIKTAQEELSRLLDDFNVRKPDLEDEASRAILMKGAAEQAREALLQQGMSKTQVEAMPAFQLVALHALREHRLTWQEVAKWVHIRDGWRHPAYEKDAKRYQEAIARLDLLFFRGLLRGLETDLMPASSRFAAAPARFERRVAALCCIEALRAHAAENGGKLPARLEDVTVLPVPEDPAFRKMFEYKKKADNETMLIAASPDENDKTKAFRFALTVTSRK